ncbi:MAG: hypothetical protein QOK11_3581 [Pseudonocardiales bacterium]|nr:hypothetical protein [Pseudonocardiales bacterium]
MDVPMPTAAVAAFAEFVRHRLADVGGTLCSGVGDALRSGVGDALAPGWPRRHDAELMVVVGAAAPFGTTSHARVRLLRQAHASGLLTARETERAVAAIGAPR